MPAVPLTEDERKQRYSLFRKNASTMRMDQRQIAYLVKVLRAQNLPLSLSQRPKNPATLERSGSESSHIDSEMRSGTESSSSSSDSEDTDSDEIDENLQGEALKLAVKKRRETWIPK